MGNKLISLMGEC